MYNFDNVWLLLFAWMYSSKNVINDITHNKYQQILIKRAIHFCLLNK